MKYLSLTLPDGTVVKGPASLPSGGIDVVQGVVKNALSITITIAIIICLIVIVWSGFQWASSGGDKNKVAQARSRLTFAVIGLVVVLVAFFIVSIIATVFNVKLF